MPNVPWTKFQDFYLRLGFLKVLMVALSPFRRSASNDSIYQKLESPLFKPVATWPPLVDHAATLVTEYTEQEKLEGKPYILEALLIAGDCPSWLFAVTPKTIYKILDWGHDVQFVGRGNQITERGLLLRNLIPKSAEEFLAGNVDRWNPFALSSLERLFLLFHLSEIDRVTLLLIDLLAEQKEGEILESSDAAKLTCRALFEVLDDSKPNLSPRFLPEFRVAFDLAMVIARELGMNEYLPAGSENSPIIRKIPRPLKSLKRTGTTLQASGPRRKPNKNADHQTIPRFEQLVDLGFLTKTGIQGEQATTAPQRRWRYRPTEYCKLWKNAKQSSMPRKGNWMWSGFARTAVESILRERKQPNAAGLTDIIRFFSDAYDAVHRPIGHTPLESVALLAMIRAAVEGHVIEMRDFHCLMLAIKKGNLLPDHMFFASGNDVDTMFINLRRGYREKLQEIEPSLLRGINEEPTDRTTP